jgi:NAD+ kinase
LNNEKILPLRRFCIVVGYFYSKNNQMQIAVYSRCGNEKQEQQVVRLVEILQKRTKVLLYEPVYRYVSAKHNLHLDRDELFGSGAELGGDVACLVSVGGDGTMLDAAALAVQNDIPIVGFSTGRLGFLSEMGNDNLDTTLELLLNRRFDIEYRTMLHVEGCPDGSRFALNDIRMHKRGSAIAEINVHINGEFLSTYWADGLIVSTPTGSTAYSLSAGGPIISPAAACFVVAPIAAHNLNVRPVVVPDNSVISIEMSTRNRNIVVGVDSREYEMADDMRLIIRKYHKSIGFVKLPNTNFYQMLREKLLWGMDTRINA